MIRFECEMGFELNVNSSRMMVHGWQIYGTYTRLTVQGSRFTI